MSSVVLIFGYTRAKLGHRKTVVACKRAGASLGSDVVVVQW